MTSGPAQGHTAINDRYKRGFLEWRQGRSLVVGDLVSLSPSTPPRLLTDMPVNGRRGLKFPRGTEAVEVWQPLGLWTSVSMRSHPPYSLVPNISFLYWLYLHYYAPLPIVDWLGTDLFLLS